MIPSSIHHRHRHLVETENYQQKNRILLLGTIEPPQVTNISTTYPSGASPALLVSNPLTRLAAAITSNGRPKRPDPRR